MPALNEIHQLKILLRKLSLTNYRGFGSLEIDFSSTELTNVLIADNGGGKTSILDAIAEFLQYFLYTGIKGHLFDSSLSKNKSKDILNGRTTALCEATFELSYPFPQQEIFELIKETADYLNDFQIEGLIARWGLDESENDNQWIFYIEQNTKELTYIILDEKWQQKLKKVELLGNIRNNSFIIAKTQDGCWQPNLNITASDMQSHYLYTGDWTLRYELNKAKTEFILSEREHFSDAYILIQAMKNKLAYLNDFYETAKYYTPSTTSYITLPLIAYYGGSSINISFEEISIKYEDKPFQAYEDALAPKRFNFEDFLEWFQSLREEPFHILNLVTHSILSVLNADEHRYSNLRIEKGVLKLDKHTSQQEIYQLQVSQLSAGEKNMFALIADLTKRAIQLNPVLFEIDYSPENNIYSDPLKYTTGIVLIDEIDLHLHPKWQRTIIPKLRELFPLIQFIITTHSPLALQEVDGVIFNFNNNIIEKTDAFGGWRADEIFKFMGVKADYGTLYEELVSDFYDAIHANDQEKAQTKYDDIVKLLPEETPFKKTLKNRLNLLKEDWL